MAKVKKSLKEAHETAKEHSMKFPEIPVWVMDKKGKKAVISTSSWVHRERIFEGWHTVATYRNGVKVDEANK